MSDIAIRVENLSKKYSIGETIRQDTLRDALAHALPRIARIARRNGNSSNSSSSNSRQESSSEFWALKDVSFEVKRGEVVGVIGRNGAGKSTLLKVLSRITEPTSGVAEIHGRVGSLLEVGTGFHPELTGRENIYLNGAILGMKRVEIDRKFDEIVAFAEIEKFLDTPVKRYSSGMYVRLAFAVAAHLEPEILLVDEVLSVGDAAFQKKCLGKMGDVAREGRTVLFVSHNMAAVESLCYRVILLDAGSAVFDGDPGTAIGQYLNHTSSNAEVQIKADNPRVGTGVARYTRVRISDKNGRSTDSIRIGDDLVVEMEFRCEESLNKPSFGVVIRGPLQERVLQVLSKVTHGEMPMAVRGGVVRVRIKNVNLVPGTYYLTVGMSRQNEQIDHVQNILKFQIAPADVYGTGQLPNQSSAMIVLPCRWQAMYS